jgi:HTH-type transcriptional regulator, transcriptional repressor of NAD biosynthesis genes
MKKEKKIGLVFGKFSPPHRGHEALIRFGQKNCDKLYVLLCDSKTDTIPSKTRLGWMLDMFKDDLDIEVRITDVDLPVVPYSSKLISKMWSEHLTKIFPDVNVLFTSERYGDFTAEFMGIEHMIFDNDREEFFVSATKIRNHPFVYWNYIPDVVKPYFVKKICICGTESTGKSTLTEKLAKRFHTNFVPEWGRTICPSTELCTPEMIMEIGEAHSKDINEKINFSNKFLFSDTDLNTTKMYSYFLFNEIPKFKDWIEEANKFDLYIFLENDAPFIQDGTRLVEEKRNELRDYHYDYLISQGCNVHVVNGYDWEIRYEKAIRVIEENFG